MSDYNNLNEDPVGMASEAGVTFPAGEPAPGDGLDSATEAMADPEAGATPGRLKRVLAGAGGLLVVVGRLRPVLAGSLRNTAVRIGLACAISVSTLGGAAYYWSRQRGADTPPASSTSDTASATTEAAAEAALRLAPALQVAATGPAPAELPKPTAAAEDVAGDDLDSPAEPVAARPLDSGGLDAASLPAPVAAAEAVDPPAGALDPAETLAMAPAALPVPMSEAGLPPEEPEVPVLPEVSPGQAADDPPGILAGGVAELPPTLPASVADEAAGSISLDAADQAASLGVALPGEMPPSVADADSGTDDPAASAAPPESADLSSPVLLANEAAPAPIAASAPASVEEAAPAPIAASAPASVEEAAPGLDPGAAPADDAPAALANLDASPPGGAIPSLSETPVPGPMSDPTTAPVLPPPATAAVVPEPAVAAAESAMAGLVALPNVGERIFHDVEPMGQPRSMETRTVALADITGEKDPPARPAAAAAAASALELMDPIEAVSHIVQSGENFQTIARLYYGSARYYQALWKANADQFEAPEALTVGATIRVPPPELLDRVAIEQTTTPAAAIEPDIARTAAEAASGKVVKAAAPVVGEPIGDSRSVSSRRGELMAEADDPSEFEGRYHVVASQTETFRSIARDTLGNARRADEIRDMNLDVLGDRERLVPGMRLRLPPDAANDQTVRR